MAYLINTRMSTPTAIPAGAVIPTGNVIHKAGNSIIAGGNNIQINGSGYYKIIANASISASAVGDQTLTINSNGMPIAVAIETVDTAGGSANLTAIAIVYNRCGCATNIISFTAGFAGEVDELDVIVERM